MNVVKNKKSELRAELKAARQKLTDAQRIQKNQLILRNLFKLAPVQDCKSVFCFISTVNEVDTHAIINHFLESKKHLTVPRISAEKNMQAIVFQSWAEMEKGQLGILSPKHSEPIASKTDITLTPGLAFSAAGARLGYGRGYYDRWFVENDGGLKIALAYEIQILEEIPVDEHDVIIDIIVTEDRVINTAQ
ncbi:MAG: 5-formyltetrahydrofolate cyclo-ligase [Gammaproteobacteria bacterium]|nr:5-formyltetrahydrofolate cyclo-ligase [Gammaproteobacteria bacterium]